MSLQFPRFRAYQLAVAFHRSIESLSIPSYLRDQLLRASSSVVLNIAEASGKLRPPTSAAISRSLWAPSAKAARGSI